MRSRALKSSIDLTIKYVRIELSCESFVDEKRVRANLNLIRESKVSRGAQPRRLDILRNLRKEEKKGKRRRV